MSSNNNPNPRLPTLGTPEPVSTQVHIGDRTFETRGMSTATGLEIYNILPAEGKAEADRLANVVNKAARVLKAAQKNGVDANELALNWVKTGNDEAAKIKLPPQQQAAIRELEGSGMKFGDIVHLIPGGDTVRGIGMVGGAVGGTASAAVDGFVNGPQRMFNLVTTLGKEGVGFFTGYGVGQVEDNARAFASAVVALRREEEAKRHNQPFIDIPFDGKPSQVWSNPLEYAKAAGGTVLDFVAQNLPFADVVIAVVNSIKQFSEPKEDRLTWKQLLAQAQEQIAEAKQKEPADFAHIKERFTARVEQEMYGKDGQAVAARLEAADTIAGLKTQGIAAAVTAPTITTRDHQGVDTTLKNGEVEKQITVGQRIANATNNFIGDGSLLEKGVRGGLTLTGAAFAGNGAFGVAEGLVRGHLTAPTKAAEAAQKRVNQLNGYTDAKGNHVKGQIQLAEEAGPRQHFWELGKKTPQEIAALKTEAQEAAAKAAERTAVAQQRAVSTVGQMLEGAAKPISEINEGSKAPGFFKVFNVSRWLGRGAGDIAGAAVASVKDTPVGFVQGVASWVAGTPIGKASNIMELGGRFLGKTAVGATFLTPALAGAAAVNDLGGDKKGDAAVHGSEALATGGVLIQGLLKGGVKMGLKRVPFIGPIVSTAEGGLAIAHHDNGGMIRAGTELGATGIGTAIGAGVGCLGGPFAPVSVPAGMAVGAFIGGVVGMFGGMFAEHNYNKNHPKQEQQTHVANSGQLPADRALSAAAIAATEQARIAQAAASNSDAVMRAQMAANRLQFRTSTVHAPNPSATTLPPVQGNAVGASVG